jgi:hypothetical protein
MEVIRKLHRGDGYGYNNDTDEKDEAQEDASATLMRLRCGDESVGVLVRVLEHHPFYRCPKPMTVGLCRCHVSCSSRVVAFNVHDLHGLARETASTARSEMMDLLREEFKKSRVAE